MMNGECLELFHSLPHSGHEGFLSDLTEEYASDDFHEDDVEYILEVADHAAFDLAPPWLDLKIDRILENE